MSAFTAIENWIRQQQPELEAVVSVLQVAQSITGLGGAAAATGLKVFEAALEAGASGASTHEQMMAELVKAHEDLAGQRAAEDAEIAAKLPPAAA